MPTPAPPVPTVTPPHVSVKVMGSGAVDEVKVKSSPDGALGACVARAVQTAAFARTQKGGTLSHSFRF